VTATTGSPGIATRRPRTILYTCIGAAVVIAVFVAVLASAKPSSDNTTSPLIGKAAPAITGPSLSGQGAYSLAQFSGKWVLVNFAASWCVPCRQETPQLLTFNAQHHAAGNATVLAVAFDPSDQANLERFLKQTDATWPTVSDPAAEVAYGVTQIPQSFLVDPSGTVVAKYFGEVSAAQINDFIAKATATG
jgi:cytochrome c biogenesis protein CcmG/thiol:disulfide interchange protein DsbE